MAAVRSELAGLPATEALTGIAILAAIAFVSAFALTTKATPKAAIAIEAHEVNDIDLPPAGKPVATTGGSAMRSVAEVKKKAAERPPAAQAAAAAQATGAGPVAGWLTVTAPMDFQIVEKGQLLGSTAVPRLMLPVGKHELVIGSPELGFSEARTVDIGPGRTTNLTVRTPEGKVNINARPWANVSVDGQAIGQTPLADVSLRRTPRGRVPSIPISASAARRLSSP